MNTSSLASPLLASTWPTSASLPYMVAVSMCRYPAPSAARIASRPALPRNSQVPKPIIGIVTPPGRSTAGTEAASVMGSSLQRSPRSHHRPSDHGRAGAGGQAGEQPGEPAGHRARRAVADGAPVDRGDRREPAHGAGDEHLVRGVELGQAEVTQ